MSEMISVASGFQYSVNIGYDLNNEEKIKNFIPTASALKLLEDILLSTSTTSNDRARVLIGAYGKGKSHIMLMILSMLLKKDIHLFDTLLAKIEGTKLYQAVENYYESDNKILPVVITGSNTSLTQAFLLGLQRTLSENELANVMPETNYQAAARTILKWEQEFPETFDKFKSMIDTTPGNFIEQLKEYNVLAYQKFEEVYPLLTAGSVFNPFLGFDVVELFENAAKGLKTQGYTGIFVVYDEFSKYLEANIASASVSDTKMLQDFAEKCNRSGKTQMHIMLISHKEIANYIDVLPKQKVDGWRGVSERFLHVRLSNNFSQTYEIIEAVIKKDNQSWERFCTEHTKEFSGLESRYFSHPMFSGMDEREIVKMIRGCYPLHPASTFVLPRLSERVAQNERTLFTFLSAKGIATLPAYLDDYSDDRFELIAPDRIYDYFEPLLKKEVYSGSLHTTYVLTELILEKLESTSLESRIVKTLSLIYILEQFEKLKPTKEEIYGIYSTAYSTEEIEKAIVNLVEHEYVVYLKRSNNYLQLKQSSGVDVRKRIKDVVEANRSQLAITRVLERVNFDSYLYPARYNDSHEMIRFFSFIFVSSKDFDGIGKLYENQPIEKGDGIVFGVLLEKDDDIEIIKRTIAEASTGLKRAVFILPRCYKEIEQSARDFDAVSILREQSINDPVLFDEYEVVYEDLRDFISSFISGYTKPEQFQSIYIYDGEERKIKRKASLTGLLSDICDNVYGLTPVINNEALNRNEATTTSRNSRNKVVAAMLRNELEANLGFTGTGQEVSIMRSTLIRTGLLEENEDGSLHVNLQPKSQPLISGMISVIEEFIQVARTCGKQSFSSLYLKLCSNESQIALRKELVPIYLAVVLHEHKQDVVLKDRFGQVVLGADTILQINTHPENYILEYLDWSPEKIQFVEMLEPAFKDNISEGDKNASPYDYIIQAMKRWYISLPKYTKEMKVSPDGTLIDRGYSAFIKLLRQNPSGHEFLFEQVPSAFGYNSLQLSVVDNVISAKNYYDTAIRRLKMMLTKEIKELFVADHRSANLEQMSLSSVIRDWCDSLNKNVFEQVFADGTDRVLSVFMSITNDEDQFVSKISKALTDLRMEDWDDGTLRRCVEALSRHKTTAESFQLVTSNTNDASTEDASNVYQVSFISENGEAETKRFERVETGKRAGLLRNKLKADLDSFGQAVTEAEKRQILMEVLKSLC